MNFIFSAEEQQKYPEIVKTYKALRNIKDNCSKEYFDNIYRMQELLKDLMGKNLDDSSYPLIIGIIVDFPEVNGIDYINDLNNGVVLSLVPRNYYWLLTDIALCSKFKRPNEYSLYLLGELVSDSEKDKQINIGYINDCKVNLISLIKRDTLCMIENGYRADLSDIFEIAHKCSEFSEDNLFFEEIKQVKYNDKLLFDKTMMNNFEKQTSKAKECE